MILLLTLLGCGGAAPEVTFDTASSARAEVLDLCEAACAHQAEGAGCSPETHLDWCVETCRTVDGILPAECLPAAEAAYACWADIAWRCVSLDEHPQELWYMVPVGDCEAETEALFTCG